MGLIQADFGDVERRSTSNSADEAFQRIFGFPSSVIRESAWRALRVATGTDGVHSQLSAAGSKFYHEFVSEVELSSIPLTNGAQIVRTITKRLHEHTVLMV